MGDIKNSLFRYFDGLMRPDAELKGLMSDPMRIYPISAPKDTKFDYIVHNIDINETDFIGVNQGAYTIHIWHNDSKPSGIWAIENRIITLMDYRSFSAIDGDGDTDVYSCRTWLQDRDQVEDDMEDIWHSVLIFYLRFDRFREIANILSR